MVTGSSMSVLSAASHCAPTAPSTTRWSQLRVTVTIGATCQGSSPSRTDARGMTESVMAPIASAQDCGEMTIGAADFTPYLPRSWMENVPNCIFEPSISPPVDARVSILSSSCEIKFISQRSTEYLPIGIILYLSNASDSR